VTIEIANESGEFVDETALVALARHVLDEMGVHPAAELSVLLVDLVAMSALHERWMGEAGPTDVLAFPMDELEIVSGPDDADNGPALLGDVVLCPVVARRQAVAAGHPVQAELHLLCTHGILHLLGYDHAEPDEEREMFGLQRKILASWRASGASGRVAGRVADGGTGGGGGGSGGGASS